jgi:adenine-specific DNA-methyltransferase
MSKITKEQELLNEIEKLQKQLEIANNRVKTAKYGLVWMEVPEAFEQETENQMPVLEEVKEKAIKNDDGKPTHILIEGDNYHALTCLNYTHKEKIDLIYIDPPYNTGKDGFTYKDKRIIDKFPDGTIVPKDHPLRHSYWLSFMFKRLELAKGLLRDTGKIVVSIDDNELANLVLICSEVFGSLNQVAILPTIMNLKGNQDQFGFAGTHEYTVVFAKEISKCKFNEFELDDAEMEKWQEDEIGYFKKGAPMRATGEEDKREDRAEMFYPILIKEDEASTITKEEHSKIYNKENKTFDDDYLKTLIQKYENDDFEIVLPLSGDDYGRWRWGFSENNKKRLKTDVIISRTKNGISLYKKQRPELNELPSRKPKSLFYKPEYSSGNGTAQIKDILGSRAFKNPKPVDLIKDLISVTTSKTATILDFFAGSGTTLQACLELNNNDFNLQNIICTNDEGNICKEVTYPRCESVIKGYKNQKNQKIKPLGNSLKYYKTSFVGKNNILSASDEDKSSLAHKAGYLLAIAENTMDEIEATPFYQFFETAERVTAVYFKEEMDEMNIFLQKVEALQKPVSLYLFSWGNSSDFEGLFDHIPNLTIKTIPQPILEIYKNIYNIISA